MFNNMMKQNNYDILGTSNVWRPRRNLSKQREQIKKCAIRLC